MKINASRAALICGMFIGLTGSAGADAEQCQSALDSYNSATSDVSDALKPYADCVDDSQGHDDCDSEFMRLKSAQDDFESAVSNYRNECN